MALTQEDLDQIKELFGSQAPPAPVPVEKTDEQVAQDRISQVGKPDVDPEAGPEYYVHLANGEVVKSFDSASTHVEGQLVIGRYPVGE